jgi:hypothetical protein
MTSSDDDASLNDLDPAAVLGAAIAAAQKASVAKDDQPIESYKTAEVSHVSDNVHAHPSLAQQAQTKTTSDYFIKDDPPARQCDPAHGVGFEFS